MEWLVISFPYWQDGGVKDPPNHETQPYETENGAWILHDEGVIQILRQAKQSDSFSKDSLPIVALRLGTPQELTHSHQSLGRKEDSLDRIGRIFH